MSTWDFSAAGVNGLLNNTSKSKMKITMIPYEDIMRNEKTTILLRISKAWQRPLAMSASESRWRSSPSMTVSICS